MKIAEGHDDVFFLITSAVGVEAMFAQPVAAERHATVLEDPWR